VSEWVERGRAHEVAQVVGALVGVDVLERLEELLLELVVAELVLLQELHGQLPQRIQRKPRDVHVLVTAHLGTSRVRYRHRERQRETD
jgi:hypothetical protein